MAESELLDTWSHLAEAKIRWACLAGAEAMEETQSLLLTPVKGRVGVERERTGFTSSPASQIHQSLLLLAELTLSLGDRCRAEQRKKYI